MTASAILLLTLAIPADVPSQDAVRYATVAADATRAHAHYDAKTPTVGDLAKGTPLRVVAEMEPWVRVEAPAGFDMWIHADYVEFDGADGHASNNRVRARPLPSTGSESHPLGHYATTDLLLRIGASGDWAQVRGPERISAWVRAKDLKIGSVEPEGWDADWKQWAERRAPFPVPEPKPVEEPGVEPEVVVEAPPVESEEVTPTVETPTEMQPADASAVTAEPLPTPAETAEDPDAAMARTTERLEALYQRMVSDREHWDRAALDELETAVGHVLWHAQKTKTLDDGRAALRRIDVLRRSYLEAIGRQIRAAEQRGDDEVAALLRRRLEGATEVDEVPDESAVVVGLVAYRAGPLEGRPFHLERLGFDVGVHSFDGRYALDDYRGREVVLRGTWRTEGEGEAKQRTFAIRELRVLPRLDD